MTSRASIAWHYGPLLSYAGLIFWLSHQPSLPGTPGGDKLAHVIAYAGLGVLAARALWLGTRWSRASVLLWAAVGAALYGVTDEWHQSFVPGRDASVPDVAADAIGAFVGAGLWGCLQRLRARFTARDQRATSGPCSADSKPRSPS